MEKVAAMAVKTKLSVYEPWCKGCGICVVLCPHEVLQLREDKVFIYNLAACTSCKTCELHCPDYAITVGGEPLE